MCSGRTHYREHFVCARFFNYVHTEETFLSRFSELSEANASESLKNLEEIYPSY